MNSTFWLADRRHRGGRRLRAVAPRHQRLFLLRRLCRAAIHRAGDRLEHPRRLYRLREFRHRRVLRDRRLYLGGAAQALGPADPGADRRRRRARRPASASAWAISPCACAACSSPSRTLALAIVVQTFITNWDFVGGSRGVYIIRPATAPLLGSYIHYLFLVMLVLAGFAIALARTHRALDLGLRPRRRSATTSWRPKPPACRRCSLKLISTTLVGRAHGHGRRAACPITSPISIRPRASTSPIAVNTHRHAADRRHDELGRAADRRDPARHHPAGRRRSRSRPRSIC